jgi:hypothetical protein
LALYGERVDHEIRAFLTATDGSLRGRANQANHERCHRNGRQKSALDAMVRGRRRGMFETECEF